MLKVRGALAPAVRTRAARVVVLLGLVAAGASAQTGRGAATGALEGLGRGLRDIGEQMQRDADEQDRLKRQREYQQEIDAQRRRNQLAEQLAAEQRGAADDAARKRRADLIARLSPVSGTAFAVGPSLLVTNYHVISGYSRISVVDGAGKRYEASPGIIDVQNDLALLVVEGLRAVPLAVAADADIRKASRVFALGFPRPDVQGEELKITDGIINSLSGFQGEPNRVQMSAAVQPGNSGGPIVGGSGAVVGVVVSGLREGQNVNYAIKPSMILRAMAACECGLENGLKRPAKQAKPMSPEDIATSADRSVFRVMSRPSELSEARLSKADFSPLTDREKLWALLDITKLHPKFAQVVKSPDFTAWLDKQPASLVGDSQDISYPEIAIRVLDRYVAASKPHMYPQ